MRKEMEKMGKFKNYLGWRSHWRECWGMEGGEETRVTPEFRLEQLVEEEQPGGEGGAR